MIVIDGSLYNVPIVSVVRSMPELYLYAERTRQNAILRSKLLGKFMNFSVVFGRSFGINDEYHRLIQKITSHQEWFNVILPDSTHGGRISGRYYTDIPGDQIISALPNDRTEWKDLTVNFIAVDRLGR